MIYTYKTVLKMLKELRLEIISKSGLISQQSYVGHSSTFDVLWEVTSQGLRKDMVKILEGSYNNLDRVLQEYKDKFINMFMALHHNHVVKPSKYSWNWD